MIEINLLKQGHGILYKQKNIEKALSHRRARLFLLLILLITSAITLYLNQVKLSGSGSLLISKLFGHIEIVWLEEDTAPFKTPQEKSLALEKMSVAERTQTKTEKTKLPEKTPEQVPEKIPAEIPTEKKILNKEKIIEKAFYVKVTSTILPESADVVQKDILAKGFQSIHGTKNGFSKSFFVAISPEENRKSVEEILEISNIPNILWNIGKAENRKTQITSQPFIFRKKAEKLKRQINKKGLKGSILHKKVPTLFHEVLVGKFQDRKQAVPVLKQLQKAGIKGFIVKR